MFPVRIIIVMQNTEVTPEIARRIFSDAVSNGVSVEDYLQTVISNERKSQSNIEPPLSELLQNLTGKVDSSKSDVKKIPSTAYGKSLIEKFKLQGLKTP